MKTNKCGLLFLLLFSCLILLFLKLLQNSTTNICTTDSNNLPNVKKVAVKIATVLCGAKRIEEILTLLKTCLIFGQSPEVDLEVIIFSDDIALPLLTSGLKNLQNDCKEAGWDFKYKIKPTWFPEVNPNESNMTSWKSKRSWGPCKAQRLFFPSLLKEVDAVLYLDIDTLVLMDLKSIWEYFDRMSDQQFAGMTRHSEYVGSGHYFRQSKSNQSIPYYTPTGLDSGVMLMNLTRMRAFSFEEKMIKYRMKYDDRLYLYDQDLLNILFHYHPNKVYVLPCSYNFNQGHCDLTESEAVCKFAEESGVSILHGTGRSFFKEQAPFFKPIYRIFNESRPEISKLPELLEDLKLSMGQFDKPCFGLNAQIFYKPFSLYNKIMRWNN